MEQQGGDAALDSELFVQQPGGDGGGGGGADGGCSAGGGGGGASSSTPTSSSAPPCAANAADADADAGGAFWWAISQPVGLEALVEMLDDLLDRWRPRDIGGSGSGGSGGGASGRDQAVVVTFRTVLPPRAPAKAAAVAATRLDGADAMRGSGGGVFITQMAADGGGDDGDDAGGASQCGDFGPRRGAPVGDQPAVARSADFTFVAAERRRAAAAAAVAAETGKSGGSGGAGGVGTAGELSLSSGAPGGLTLNAAMPRRGQLRHSGSDADGAPRVRGGSLGVNKKAVVAATGAAAGAPSVDALRGRMRELRGRLRGGPAAATTKGARY